MQTFKYLFTPKDRADVNLEDILEIKYPTIRSLGERFIARNSLENRYYVFPDMNKFCEYIEEVEEHRRCFHEVIVSKQKQRIKFDIDAESTRVNECFNAAFNNDTYFKVEHSLESLNSVTESEKMGVILKEIDSAICDSFYVLYQKRISPSDILTTTSTGMENGKMKYSYHKLIKGFYVEETAEAAYYVSEYFSKFMRPDFHDVIDFGVYKTIQNFRVVYNHKENSDRVKVPVHCNGDAINEPSKYYLVQNTDDCELLSDKSDKSQKSPNNISSELYISQSDCDSAIAVAVKYGIIIKGVHSIRKTNGGLITFNRLSASYCELCKRQHDTDNTLMLSIVTAADESASSPTPGMLISRVYMMCRHNKLGKIYLGSFEPEISNNELYESSGGEIIRQKDVKVTKKIIQEKILESIVVAQEESRNDKSSSNELPFDQSKFSSLPTESKNIYSSSNLKDFEHVDTLCVRAGMKMGKTKKLVEFVNKYFTDNDYYTHNIILVSFRQTFSKEIQNKFKGFTLYNEVSGEINDNRIIIQVESLHRIGITAGKHKPDLLILDECESIFDQFDSGLHKKFSESWAVFKWLMTYSSHLVCMDANLSNRTYEIISRMRPSANIPGNLMYHFNMCKNAADDTYKMTVNKNEWYLDLYNSLSIGKRIAVAISSLSEAKVLHESIATKFPALKVGFYSSKTPMSEKKLHFSNVDEYWSCYDVLIYTPTVSAGISFERTHYDKMYAYFTDNSCHAEICIQMMGRIRNLADKTYVVFIDSNKRNLPTNVDIIRSALLDSRSNLFKEIGESHLVLEYNGDGKIKFYENDYFHMWLENTRIKNLSKNNFLTRFVQLISAVGPRIIKLAVGADFAELLAIEEDNTGTKNKIKDHEAELIAKAPELTVSEITSVMNKFSDSTSSSTQSTDITDAERYGYEKFKLRRDYQWGGNIDVAFVKKYNNPRNRKIFKNLSKISQITLGNEVEKPSTLKDALKKIQQEEKVNYELALDSEERYLQDVKRKYVFDQHWLAVELLTVCGLSSLRDTSWRSQHDLKIAFKEHEKKMYTSVMKYYENYGELSKKPSIYAFTYSDTKNAREYVNGILSYVNKILLLMYGIKLASSRGDPDMYKLQLNDQFSISMPAVNNANRTEGTASRTEGTIPNVYDKWRPVDDGTDHEMSGRITYKHIEHDVPMSMRTHVGAEDNVQAAIAV